MADLYATLCSYQNLFLAYQKARKGKIQKEYILDFEKKLTENSRRILLRELKLLNLSVFNILKRP